MTPPLTITGSVSPARAHIELGGGFGMTATTWLTLEELEDLISHLQSVERELRQRILAEKVAASR